MRQDSVFDSKIGGGKRYDTFTTGRRLANGTFFESHATDKTTLLLFGMDLAPLVGEESLRLIGYVENLTEKFKSDVHQRLQRHWAPNETIGSGNLFYLWKLSFDPPLKKPLQLRHVL